MSTLISDTTTLHSDFDPSADVLVRAANRRFSPSEVDDPTSRGHVAAIEADLTAATRARDSARTLRDKPSVPASTV